MRLQSILSCLFKAAKVVSGCYFSICILSSGFAQQVGSEGIITVCAEAGHQDQPRVVSDGSGGFIIAWTDRRNGSGADIYAQKLSASGAAQWQSGGVPVCVAPNSQHVTDMISDGAGGVVIVWIDHRNSSLSGEDIYIQRIDASGAALWNTQGIAVCSAQGIQSQPVLAKGAQGGAICVWVDQRLETGQTNLFGQSINPDGSFAWQQNGQSLVNSSQNEQEPFIFSDGEGGIFAAWTEGNPGSDQYHVFTQKFDNTGSEVWTSALSPGGLDGFFQSRPRMIDDGTGGFFLFWHNAQNDSSGQFWGQHFNTDGQKLWDVNGVQLYVNEGEGSSCVAVKDMAGGVVTAWADQQSSGTFTVAAQRFGPDGTAQWNSAGANVASTTGTINRLSAVPDGTGGAVLVWSDEQSSASAVLESGHLTASGSHAGSLNGTPVGDLRNSQVVPVLASGADGAALAVWHDHPDGNNDIFAGLLNAQEPLD